MKSSRVQCIMSLASQALRAVSIHEHYSSSNCQNVFREIYVWVTFFFFLVRLFLYTIIEDEMSLESLLATEAWLYHFQYLTGEITLLIQYASAVFSAKPPVFTIQFLMNLYGILKYFIEPLKCSLCRSTRLYLLELCNMFSQSSLDGFSYLQPIDPSLLSHK